MPYGTCLQGIYGAGGGFSLEFNGSDAYLSMSDANFGSYDRDLFAIALSLNVDSLASNVTICCKGDIGTPQGDQEFEIEVNGSGSIEARFYHGTSSSPETSRFESVDSAITAGQRHDMLVIFDRSNGDTSERIKVYVDGSAVALGFADSSTPYIAPTKAVTDSSEPMLWGVKQNEGGSFSQYFDGRMQQLAFISGSRPDPNDVFDGAGKLKDLSGFSGLHSYIRPQSGIVTDSVLAADWTNNNGVTIGTDKL